MHLSGKGGLRMRCRGGAAALVEWRWKWPRPPFFNMAQALGLHLLPETCFDELFSAFTCCSEPRAGVGWGGARAGFPHSSQGAAAAMLVWDGSPVSTWGPMKGREEVATSLS